MQIDLYCQLKTTFLIGAVRKKKISLIDDSNEVRNFLKCADQCN